MPPNLPAPLIYGPAFPDLILKMENGRQVVDSRTNETLHLDSSDFDDQGTFTLGRLLSSRTCTRRHFRNCGGLIEGRDLFDEPVVKAAWPSECPAILGLLDSCQAEGSRRFMELWMRAQARLADTAMDEYNARNQSVRNVYAFPALIPEVWLNYLGPRKTTDDDIHLEENPSRVDFVMFAVGKECVIEIDGPSHYADYDEAQRRYAVSERRYTKNLRIERSLRRQGWEIYRFSNLEVQTATESNFGSLIADLPGVDDDRDIPF